MVKKKKEEVKDKPSPKKTVEVVEKIEKYPIAVLFEKNNIRPMNALGFLKFYGLSEDFAKEHEGIELDGFSQEEFMDLYERYMKREI